VKIWTEELTKASTEIVQAKLQNKVIEEVPIEVTIQLPAPMLRAIITASEKTGSDPDEIMSEMASQGFKASVDSQLTSGKSSVVTELKQSKESIPDIFGQLKGLGLDMSGLESKMGEFNNLMSMLNGMKEQMENVSTKLGNESSGENTKNLK
jgi:hypothetical protein